MSLRTPLKQARGLGSSSDGTHHWWSLRVAALALIPLSLWFIAGVVGIVGASHAEAVGWVRQPLVTVLLILFLATAFIHSKLGVDEVVEDYVHHRPARVAVLLLNTFFHVLLGATAVVAVLRIAFGG